MASKNQEVYFGSYLRNLRNIRGKTIKELAKALGLSQSYILAFEKGDRPPQRPEDLGDLLEFLEATEQDRIALRGLAKLDRLMRVLRKEMGYEYASHDAS